MNMYTGTDHTQKSKTLKVDSIKDQNKELPKYVGSIKDVCVKSN